MKFIWEAINQDSEQVDVVIEVDGKGGDRTIIFGYSASSIETV